MTIAIAQMKVVPGQPALNAEAMLALIGRARQQGAELIIFPELAVSGLLIGDLAFNKAFIGECQDVNRRIAAESDGIMVVYGNVELREGGAYNAVFLAAGGENGRLDAPMGQSFILGAYDGFARSREHQVYNLPVDGKILRCGFILGDWRGEALPYSANDLDILVDLSNKPLMLNDVATPPRVAGRQMISLNSYGLQNSGKTNYLFAGGSAYYDIDGSLIARGETLSDGLYIWSRRGGEQLPRPQGETLLGEALVRGVREFTAMINCRRAVVGVEDGVDSKLAACVYARALGPENVYLLAMPDSGEGPSPSEELARALGTNFATIPLGYNVNNLKKLLSAHRFTAFNGLQLALEFDEQATDNMRSRERCHLLAAASAALEAMFTCNSNKTELCVGAASCYGDLAGAFAAQADLWQFQIYQAAEYFRRLYPVVPWGADAAELRLPPQTELPAAVYHDYLLRFWAEENYDLSATLALYNSGRLEEKLGCAPGLAGRIFLAPGEFIADCEKWWSMYRGSGLTKRIQAPPLLALSRNPFGGAKSQSQGAVYYNRHLERIKGKILGEQS